MVQLLLQILIRLISGLLSGLLLFFTLRRIGFTLVAFFAAPHRETETPLQLEKQSWPQILILIPFRNEVETLPGLIAALQALDYPAGKITLVFINDGSTDDGGEIIKRHAQNRPNWHHLRLETNLGKAAALNQGLAQFAQGEIVVIYDADERPAADSLQFLVAPFAVKNVGGVSGRRIVSNASQSPAASYTAYEGLVHQWITVRAKDVLNLAPPILGSNCAYRRQALQSLGGFKIGALLEDTDLTLRLARSGWRLRYAVQSRSYHQAPYTLAGYWRQHTRWARGFTDAAHAEGPAILTRSNSGLGWPLRLELLLFSAGYLDRLALLLSLFSLGFLNLSGRKNETRGLQGMIALHLLMPFGQIIIALKLGRASRALWRGLIWLPFFFLVDIAMAVYSFARSLVRRPQGWEERSRRN